MSDNSSAADLSVPGRARVETLDPQINSIQPGGGFCMRSELLWGHLRRWILKTFFASYVEQMKDKRRGQQGGCPHEVLDPRDVKFYRNQETYSWSVEDDPFDWRNYLPVARVGLAELILIGGGNAALALIFAFVFWPLAVVFGTLAIFMASFFRNPNREAPTDAGLIISPADGKVTSIDELPYVEYLGGPAVRIGIFLSVFNVHINRSPVAAKVIGLTYRRGKFLNALKPESARENEQMEVRLEENAAPYRRFIVSQIAGAIARRIVCWIAPGEDLDRGAQFGMIKLGSRTELVLPREAGLSIDVKIGDKVSAGTTVMARYDRPRVE